MGELEPQLQVLPGVAPREGVRQRQLGLAQLLAPRFQRARSAPCHRCFERGEAGRGFPIELYIVKEDFEIACAPQPHDRCERVTLRVEIGKGVEGIETQRARLRAGGALLQHGRGTQRASRGIGEAGGAQGGAQRGDLTEVG